VPVTGSLRPCDHRRQTTSSGARIAAAPRFGPFREVLAESNRALAELDRERQKRRPLSMLHSQTAL
jgi:hypothetical protein